MRRLILALIALVALRGYSLTVSSYPLGILLQKTADIDYGNYGYRYAPSVIVEEGHERCWFCAGTANLDNPDYAPDNVAYTEDWMNPQVVLCAATDHPRTPIEACQGQFPTGQDSVLVCDPTVLNIGGTYYDFYTGADGSGMNNQLFLATSNDRIHWTKYPSASAEAVPVIPFPEHTGRYGVGEASAVYKDGLFWVWHNYAPYLGSNSIYLSKSPNGNAFTTYGKIFSESVAPSPDSVDVKYIPGWDIWFYVIATPGYDAITWNVSRDGLHWLPWNDSNFGYKTRLISVPRRFAVSPALAGDGFGHLGDGSLTSTRIVKVVYAAGDSDIGEFYLWTLDGVQLQLSLQSASGVLEEVDQRLVAKGWVYDSDSGVNDAASNGERSRPLGFDTPVRGVATSVQKGTRYETGWLSSQVERQDIVALGMIPDPYHGFSVDFSSLHLPPGTYRLEIEALEYPFGTGATTLANAVTVTIPGSAPAMTLRTYNGNYVSAYGCGGSYVAAYPVMASTCEMFQFVDLNGGALVDGDQIRLIALNGNYVTTEEGGCPESYCVVNANRAMGGAWETLAIHKNGGGQIHSGDAISLQSINGYYVCAESGGGDVVTATRTVPLQWETFVVQFMP